MNKYLLVLQKILALLTGKLIQFIFNCFKSIFSKKTILFVSKGKIRSYTIGPVSQMMLFLFIFWMINLFTESLIYDNIINQKDVRISDLKKANTQFKKEAVYLHANLNKINDYFILISEYEDPNAENKTNSDIEKRRLAKFKTIFNNINLDNDDQKIALTVAGSHIALDDIKAASRKRIVDLEEKISITGLALFNNKLITGKRYKNNPKNNPNSKQTEISLNDSNDLLNKRQGGPFQGVDDLIEPIATDSNSKPILNRIDINDEINHLSYLEEFIHYAPLSKPMRNYYISSGFGKRIDPIRKVRADHNGMDFVGHKGEKIISPSRGTVKLSGRYGSYGKILIIDHGYGITTRYGHLLKVKVKKGDYVKKGQVIAVQGNSGRSTGDHLHYEIRYNNRPLDPRKFIHSGQEIFNKNQI